MNSLLLKYLFAGFILIGSFYSANSQDMLVKSNGSRIMVNIEELTDDSISFTNAYSDEKFLFKLPKSEIKYIEYTNGDIEYFDGSYQNLSIKDTIVEFNSIELDDNNIVIDSVSISLQNLFLQQNLVFDFTAYRDTSLIVEKGKVSFVFGNEKKNFSERCYPTDEKNVFAKFVLNLPSSKKHLERLSELEINNIIVSFPETEINLQLTEEQSKTLKNIFANNQIGE